MMMKKKTQIWLISVHRKPLDLLSTSNKAADYQDNTFVNQTVIHKTTNALQAVTEAQNEVSVDDMTWFFADYRNYACMCPSIPGYLDCSCGMQKCVAPLDTMFRAIEDPFEARDVGNAWLNILSSEGCDVSYLEEEKTLHTAQSQITPSGSRCQLRQLLIELGESLSVSWRWRYDPNCSAYLVQEEFASWNIHHNDPDPWFRPEWTETWPFEYSERAGPFDRYKGYIPGKGDEMYNEWKRLHKLAQRRAENRLWKRAAKLGLLGGRKQDAPMPGSWPYDL